MEPTGFEPVTSCLQSLPTTLRAIAVCCEACRNRGAGGIRMAVFHVALQSAATQPLPAAEPDHRPPSWRRLVPSASPGVPSTQRFASGNNWVVGGWPRVGGGAEMTQVCRAH